MSKQYIRNMGTGKIELHFNKEDYQSLPDSTKKLIKSNFLFSRYSGAWVSRCKEPNLYHVIQVAKQLGFTEEQRIGERLSFAEQQEHKTERAEVRADRYEQYAVNAGNKAKSMQAEFNECRKDLSWLTQPNINSSSGRAFTNRKNKIVERYGKGFNEYRKYSDFRERAETARNTASSNQLNDKVYLNNRIKECQKSINQLNKNIVSYEEILTGIEKGESSKYTIEQVNGWINEALDRLEAEIDKQAYYQNYMDVLGGVTYSRDNIKSGYIVQIRGRHCQIIKANIKTVDIKSISTGMILRYDYAEIQSIVKAEEVKPKQEAENHPYKTGEILIACRPADNSIYKAYQITKITAKTIQIQQIEISEGRPMSGQFKNNSKPERKKPIVRKYTNEWTVYDNNDWQLTKYIDNEVEKRCC